MAMAVFSAPPSSTTHLPSLSPSPRSVGKAQFFVKPNYCYTTSRRYPLLNVTVRSADNGSGVAAAVTVEADKSSSTEEKVEVPEAPVKSEEPKEVALESSNGSPKPQVAAAALAPEVVKVFEDSRWVNGTWDLAQFQKDGKTDWDDVIAAVYKLSTGNNNYLQLSLAKANYPFYGIDFAGGKATGRFTNGRTIGDIISEKLGIQPPPPYLSLAPNDDAILKGVNYASGGAGILNDTGLYFIQRLSFDDQINSFEKTKQVMVNKIGEAAANELCNRAVSNDYVNNFLQPFLQDGQQYTHDEFVELLTSTLGEQLTDRLVADDISMGRKGSWFSSVKKALSAQVLKKKKTQKESKSKKKWGKRRHFNCGELFKSGNLYIYCGTCWIIITTTSFIDSN